MGTKGYFSANFNGNLKSDGTNSYTYDYQNRLIEVTQSGTTIAQYQYDILGRRIHKVTPTEAITYIYAGDNIIQEIRTLGGGTNNPLTLKKTYINGLGTDNLIAYDNEESTNQDKISFCQTRVLPYSTEFQSYGYQSIIDDCTTTMSSSTGITTNRYYYHTNHLGSIVALTNNSGNTVQTYSYDSFGKAYIVNGSGTLTSIDTATNLYGNTRLYTGREYDKEVSLYFNRARYYNPDTGRFISRDPIGQNDQINLYTYVANSPMNYVDREGRRAKTLVILGVDRDGMLTEFNPDGTAIVRDTNDGKYVSMMYNILHKQLKGNFEVRLVTNFEEFDNAINEKMRDNIYYIDHGIGLGQSITTNAKNTDYSNSLNGNINTIKSLFNTESLIDKNNLESITQYVLLKNTTFTIFSCNAGSEDNPLPIAQSLQNHYNFQYTDAPTKDITIEFSHPDEYGIYTDTKENSGYMRRFN